MLAAPVPVPLALHLLSPTQAGKEAALPPPVTLPAFSCPVPFPSSPGAKPSTLLT